MRFRLSVGAIKSDVFNMEASELEIEFSETEFDAGLKCKEAIVTALVPFLTHLAAKENQNDFNSADASSDQQPS